MGKADKTRVSKTERHTINQSLHHTRDRWAGARASAGHRARSIALGKPAVGLLSSGTRDILMLCVGEYTAL